MAEKYPLPQFSFPNHISPLILPLPPFDIPALTSHTFYTPPYLDHLSLPTLTHPSLFINSPTFPTHSSLTSASFHLLPRFPSFITLRPLPLFPLLHPSFPLISPTIPPFIFPHFHYFPLSHFSHLLYFFFP